MELIKQVAKKIGIFGLGLTGRSAYKALFNIADFVICYDDSADNINIFNEEFGANEAVIGIADSRWKNLDKILISPGIAHSHPIFELCHQFNIPITSDIELFMEENPESEFILISGSNGKSTTTALIGHILKDNGFDYQIGGNIGLPVLSLPKDSKGYILEISSFQIDLLKTTKVKMVVLLNVTPNHLDRYSSFAEYAQSKERLLSFEAETKILSVSSEYTANLYQQIKHKPNLLIVTTHDSGITKSIICHKNAIIDNYFFFSDEYNHFHYEAGILQGRHNCENIGASYAVCKSLGLETFDIIRAIKTFQGLEHRMQYLGSKGNVSFYNDSKATTITAACAALQLLPNILWLAGGIFKEYDFTPLYAVISNVRKAYLFGESKEIFAQNLESKLEYELFATMEDALIAAMKDASLENQLVNILLSPACSSYDQFKNFEDRGQQFIDLVKIGSNQ